MHTAAQHSARARGGCAMPLSGSSTPSIFRAPLMAVNVRGEKFVAPTGLERVHENLFYSLVYGNMCTTGAPYIEHHHWTSWMWNDSGQEHIWRILHEHHRVTEFILGVESGENNCNTCRTNHTAPGVCGSLVSLQTNISITINDIFKGLTMI